MKKNLYKDARFRQKFATLDFTNLVTKTLFLNTYIPMRNRRFLYFWWQKFFFLSAHAQTRNICIFTGRGRGVFQQWRSSRFIIKKYTSMGLLPGLRKYGW